MAYTPTNWQNLPNTTTPVNATNLNKIETELSNLEIENITNSNGTAIKYPDGTMICYGSFDVNKSWDTWGSMYAIDALNVATFAQGFYATPNISVTSQNSTATCWVATVHGSTTGISKITCVRPTTYQKMSLPFTYTAIGRWKA